MSKIQSPGVSELMGEIEARRHRGPARSFPPVPGHSLIKASQATTTMRSSTKKPHNMIDWRGIEDIRS